MRNCTLCSWDENVDYDIDGGDVGEVYQSISSMNVMMI